MGSYGTLIRQGILLAALVALVAALAPDGARLWVALAGLLALGFFVTVSLSRHRQVMRLTREIDEVLHEGRRVAFSDCREGDVAVLANELGKMVGRLARTSDLLAQERNGLSDALADVSHQIRTPLTAIGLMLPRIEQAQDAAERKRLVRELETMVERVSWLVTTLLKIAKADAGALTVARQPVAAQAVVSRALAPLEMAFDLHDVTVVQRCEPAASFEGDEAWTAEAVENILKNCMEHTPAGGTVTVTVTEDALATRFVIQDTGPGFAEGEAARVFERFYRGGAAGGQGPAAEGFGIGLSLAQALVSAQGGTLQAANGPQGGACFTLAFPKFVV